MNLDTLKTEIETYLETEGFAVFHGYSRALDSVPIVYWDCERYSDYKDFLKTAKAAGATLIVFHQRELSSGQLDEAFEELEASEMPRDEYRNIERRLSDLRAYEGFTCALELSFDHGGRVFMFDLQTEWYQELNDISNDLHLLNAASTDEEDDNENPMGGYFSRN